MTVDIVNSTKAYQHGQAGWRVYLGCRAEIWAHRGYIVMGESVYTTSLRDARRVVQVELGMRAPRIHTPDGEYVYLSRSAMHDDGDGSCADAVICRVRDGGAL